MRDHDRRAVLPPAKIIDLKIAGAGGNYEPGGKLRSLVAADELTFLMELEDSMTSQVLGRVGDGTISGGGSSTDDASWHEAQAAAVRWAQLFRNWLDTNLAQARR